MHASFELACRSGVPFRASTGSGRRSCPTSWNCRIPCPWSSCVPSSGPSTRRDPRPGPAARLGAGPGRPRERRPRAPLDAGRRRRRRLLRQSRHLGDALRRRARRRAGHAGHPLPLRGGRDRRRRRVRAGGRSPGGHAAAPGSGPRQRAGQPAQRPAGPDADRQHRRRPRHLPRPLRRAPAIGHRVHRRPRVGVVPLDGAGRRRGGRCRRCRGRRAGSTRLRGHSVLPADASWSESTTGPCPPRPQGRATVVPADTIEEVAKALRGGERARSSSAGAPCGPPGCMPPAGWR